MNHSIQERIARICAAMRKDSTSEKPEFSATSANECPQSSMAVTVFDFSGASLTVTVNCGGTPQS